MGIADSLKIQTTPEYVRRKTLYKTLYNENGWLKRIMTNENYLHI